MDVASAPGTSVNCLFTDHPDVDLDDGVTPLHVACYKGKTDIVIYLLDNPELDVDVLSER